jgi:predicted outer membrane protein
MNLTRLDIEQVKPEVPADLEQIAAKLLQSARKLPHGPDRQNILKEIASFRVRIAALKARMKY